MWIICYHVIKVTVIWEWTEHPSSVPKVFVVGSACMAVSQLPWSWKHAIQNYSMSATHFKGPRYTSIEIQENLQPKKAKKCSYFVIKVLRFNMILSSRVLWLRVMGSVSYVNFCSSSRSFLSCCLSWSRDSAIEVNLRGKNKQNSITYDLKCEPWFCKAPPHKGPLTIVAKLSIFIYSQYI